MEQLEFEQNTLTESELCYGDQVQLFDEQIGTIQFIGELSYGDPSKGKNRSGIYYGIALKSKTGQHNGSIRGRKYFKCTPRHGICVRIKDIECILKQSKHTQTRYCMHQLIYIKNKEQVGTIRYIGLCAHLDTDHNAGGLWFGIEIMPEYSRGKYKTTGVIQDIVYFQSSPDCNALFVQASNISIVPRHILAKLHVAKPQILAKQKKGKKEERRSSVFDILRNKITDAFSGKTEEKTDSNPNHIKSASQMDTKHLTKHSSTRQSRSRSTPKTPQKELIDAAAAASHKPQHKIPYDITTYDPQTDNNNNRHKTKHKNDKIKISKHHKLRKRSNEKLTTKSHHAAMEHKVTNNVIRSKSANPNSFKSKSKQQRYKNDPSQRPKHNSAKQKHNKYQHNSAKVATKQRHKTRTKSREDYYKKSDENERRDRPKPKIKRPRTPTAPKAKKVHRGRPKKATTPIVRKRKASPRREKSPARHKKKIRKRSKPDLKRKALSERPPDETARNRNNRHKAKRKANPIMYKAKSSEEVLLTESTQNHASIASKKKHTKHNNRYNTQEPRSWSPQQEEVLNNNSNNNNNAPYSFQTESILPTLIQVQRSIESPSTSSFDVSPRERSRNNNYQQQQQQHYDQHLGSPRAAKQKQHKMNGFGTASTAPRRKNGILSIEDRDNLKKKTIMDRAKNMMNSLPFSHSSGVNQLDVYAADNDAAFVFNDDDDEDSDSYYKKKKRKSTRSRTRDVSDMAHKIQKEKKKKHANKRSSNNNNNNRGRSKKNTKSLNNLSIKHHAHQRSKSLEVNLEDLFKRRKGTNDDDDVSQLEEHIFTSSDEDWSEDSDSGTDDSKSESDEDENCTLSLWVGTWNVGESEFILDPLMLGRWLGSNSSAMHRMHDIYVIGLQECVSQHRKAWINGLLAYVDNGRKQYLVIQKVHLMNISLIVIVNKLYMFRIRDIKCKTVACGKGNIIGNKGGVVIAMTFDETTFAFINVHLVARAERFVQRGENIQRILRNIDAASMGKFDKIDTLNQFHHVLFFGDLNYRIMKKFYDVCHLISCKKYNEFVMFDQLHHQMETNEILYGFREGDISLFPPSYRWERDRNIISNKREQPPSYTDRILYKSLPECYSFWQTKYKSCMRCFGSDHRPIMSIFRFVPRNLPRHMRKKRSKKLKNIEITFYEIRAYIDTDKTNKVQNLEMTDEICCNLYYKYANNTHCAAADDDNNINQAPIHRINGGIYDGNQHCWCWSLNVLDSLSIMPYILDPEFLITTHVYLQITNRTKSNSIIGYSVIPLFYVFPQSLIDREKIRTKYNPLFAYNENNNNDDLSQSKSTQNDRNDAARKIRRARLNDREFNSPITIYGHYIGDIKGFIHAQSELVDKHRKITTKQKYK